MQHFRDNEKKTTKNERQSAILDFIFAKFLIGYPCVSPHILFYMLVQLFCFAFELRSYHKITQIQNGHKTAILDCSLPKVSQVID